ncbi:hypothetical protein HYW36_02620 [Candidatus Saccharibacteria bacterium]|nr:hypothetical protein [Candidatus Saccharibacteria bacterium]
MNIPRDPGSVPLTVEPEVAKEYHKRRRANSIAWQPRQITADRYRIYELLEAGELLIGGPEADYIEGVAQKDNDILEILGNSALSLITAEHATTQIRVEDDGTKKEKENDAGTGSLAIVVGKETNSYVLVAIGRQTGDPNNDDTHPFKSNIANVIESNPQMRAFFSLHGMSRAKGADFLDKQGFAVIVGIGDKPSPATKALVDELDIVAKDLGLRLGINQKFLDFSTKNWQPILDKNGLVKRKVFESPWYTTRGYAQAVLAEQERVEAFTAVQMELSSAIRHTQADLRKAIFPDLESQVIGAALGYHFVRRAVGSVALLGG